MRLKSGDPSIFAVQLPRKGARPETVVDVACNVTCENERFIRTGIQHLHQSLTDNDVTGTALIVARFSKDCTEAACAAAQSAPLLF